MKKRIRSILVMGLVASTVMTCNVMPIYGQEVTQNNEMESSVIHTAATGALANATASTATLDNTTTSAETTATLDNTTTSAETAANLDNTTASAVHTGCHSYLQGYGLQLP